MAASSLQPARPETLRLAFASEPAGARSAAIEVRSFLAAQGVPDKELFSYELCVAEAANNAVEYAVGVARELQPVAEVLFTPDQVELRVTDHTPGFVLPERVPAPSARQDRGRGLFIIRSIMDEVHYLRGAQENILVMRKRRNPPPPPAGLPASGSGSGESAAGAPEPKGVVTHLATDPAFRAETLSAIFRRVAEFGNDGQLVGDQLLVDLLHLTSADWCVLRVLSLDNRQLEVAAVSEPGLISSPVTLPAAGEAAHGIEAVVATTRGSARFDFRSQPDDTEPLRAFGTGSTGLVCPLSFGGALVGTIAVGRCGGDFPFGKLQDEVVRAFAEFLAIQMVNLRHQQEDGRNRVLARDLENAHEIQRLLLPHTLPQPAGFGVAGGWQCAREVGGDFYDAVSLDDDSLVLMIADVMGKGVPAALFSTTMRGLLRGLAARSSDPAQLLGGLNRLLYAELAAVDMFITAQIVRMDLRTRQVTAASAGHCPLLFVPFGVRAVAALPVQGLPLGVRPDTRYRHQTALLGNPAMMLLHTDGLTDARNAEGRMFGQQRLMTWLHDNALAGHNAAELRDRLTRELNRFRGEAAMADDQAFLIVTEEAPAGNAALVARRRMRIQQGSLLFPAPSGASVRP